LPSHLVHELTHVFAQELKKRPAGYDCDQRARLRGNVGYNVPPGLRGHFNGY
jgi:hypothetical protein